MKESEILEWTIQNNLFDLFKYFFNIFPSQENLTYQAAKTGNLPILQFLIDNQYPITELLYEITARHGRYDCLIYLTKICKCRQWITNGLKDAARAGDVECFSYLNELLYQKYQSAKQTPKEDNKTYPELIPEVFLIILQHKRFECLKYYYSFLVDHNLGYILDGYLFTILSYARNNFEIFKYLHLQNLFQISTLKIGLFENVEVFKYEIQNGAQYDHDTVIALFKIGKADQSNYLLQLLYPEDYK